MNNGAGLLEDVVGAYDRLTEEELANLGIVLGAYRSFRGNRRAHIAYVSMPITTGKRYYDVLSAYGVRTRQELAEVAGKDALFNLVIQPNIREGVAFADACGARESLLFIAPSVFEAKRWRWTEDAYMSLWYRVMGELAGKHVVMNGWEYSTGGLKEVLFANFMQSAVIRRNTWKTAVKTFQLRDFMSDLSVERQREEFDAMQRIQIVDASGADLSLDRTLGMAVSAIEDCIARNLPCDELVAPAWTLMQVPFFSPFFAIRESFTKEYWDARKRLYAIAKDMPESPAIQ